MPVPQPTGRPLIAIVGSLDGAREDYQPPLRDLANGQHACEQLGRALAEAGCDLLVFSSAAAFVERSVVHGYAQAPEAKRGSIVARPHRNAAIGFDLPPENRPQILVQPNTSVEWEVPYYRSLMDADGILFLGGGRATRIAGIVALLQKVPALPVAAFGGGAEQVWVNLDKERNDASPEEIVRMGQPWSAESAEVLVANLLAQRDRRARRQKEALRAGGNRARAARTALMLTILALVGAWLGTSLAGSGHATGWSLLLLLALPMVASTAGALLRNFKQEEQWGWAAARGLAAGLVTVFVYLAGELVSVPDLLTRLDAQRLLFFLVPLGFTSGFAFDRVLEKVLSGETKVPALESGTRPPDAAP